MKQVIISSLLVVWGFTGTDSPASPGSVRVRPSGLAMGSDGLVYISDSVTGRIWKTVLTGS